jgi:cell wall-associated NlpC family hydrolase
MTKSVCSASLSQRLLVKLLTVSALILLSACATKPKTSTQANEPEVDLILLLSGETYPEETSTALTKLYQQHQVWRGTPYRLGGNSRAGIDCSAFVQRTYQDVFAIQLPRTTDQQLRLGKKISKSDLQTGDLIFFRRGNHVGIYMENDKFLHASTSIGVTISDMNNVYWSKYYWRSIRIQH